VVLEKRVLDCSPADVPKTSVVSEAERRRQGELLKKLRIGGSEDRVEAALELAECAVEGRVREALERTLLSDREPLVRQAAAESLRKIKDSRALPALKRAYAEDSVKEVRQAAYKAIIMIEGY
jgi:HEAT repeat protein